MSSELPDVGDSEEPTTEMILRGDVGNGSWEKLNNEMSLQIKQERTAMKRELKRGRIEAYEEGVKDTLGAIANFEDLVLKLGVSVAKTLKDGEAPSKKDLDALKFAQKTMEDMKNRAMGKAPTKHEVRSQSSILHLIAGLDNE